MKFKIDSNSSLWIKDLATEKLNAHRQLSKNASEACGALIGQEFVEHSDVVILDVTEPQPRDVRSRFHVYRSGDHSNIVVDRWRHTGKTESYVGLWHSHPEVDPTPSETDRRDWEKALKHDSYDGSRLFFVIVGFESTRVWVGHLSRCNLSLSQKMILRELETV